MKDIMVDLETMGVGYRAAIVSIGAVRFDPVACKVGNDFQSKFYETIDLEDAQAAGQTIDASTVIWWLAQSTKARAAIISRGMPLPTALRQFALFIGDNFVWGNGSNFDNRILRDAYELFGMVVPWHYRNDRDMRTLVALAETMGIKVSIPFEGTLHNALDDAIFQAQVVCELFQEIRNKPTAL